MSNGYDQGTRRHALNLTTAGIGTVTTSRGAVKDATALVEAAAVVERYLTTGQVEPEPFKIGDRTKALVFEPAGLQNLSNLQAVLDAVEVALVAVEDAAAAAAMPKAVGPYAIGVPRLGTAEVLVDVVRERDRQTGRYPVEHDDAHDCGEIAIEAAYALLPHSLRGAVAADGWGTRGWFKRNAGRRDELVTGIALAIAEVERLDRIPQPAAAANHDPESRTHGEHSATDDELPIGERQVTATAAAARTLTTDDLPAIVKEATLAASAAMEQRQRRAPRKPVECDRPHWNGKS